MNAESLTLVNEISKSNLKYKFKKRKKEKMACFAGPSYHDVIF
jgi:hypothetical protein